MDFAMMNRREDAWPRSARVFQLVAGLVGGTIALIFVTVILVYPEIVSILHEVDRPPRSEEVLAALVVPAGTVIMGYGYAAWAYFRYLRPR
jgi:hypothetical protein